MIVMRQPPELGGSALLIALGENIIQLKHGLKCQQHTKDITMKVSDYIALILAANVKHVFLVYGSAIGHIVDSVARMENLEYICTMTEMAGGYAAEGYAKITGKPAVMIATSGPGGHSLVTPIGNCFYDSVPCLFLTGQINSKFLRPDPSIRQIGFQETDIVSIVAPITKYAKMVAKPEDIRYELEKALFLCQSGRPGPVLLDLPMDVQAAEIEPDKLVGFDDHGNTPFHLPPYRDQMREYIDDLKKAKRPAILVGGGARGTINTPNSVRELGRRLGIPCFPTWNALDIIPSDFEFYGGRVGTYGGAGRNFGIQNCDLLLAIGSRISGRITGGEPSTFARDAKKYVVDVDEALLQRKLQQVPFDVNVGCDAWLFCATLLYELTNEKTQDFSDWTRTVIQWRDKYDPVRPEFFQQEAIHPYAFIRTLSQKMGPTDILVADCGGNIVVCNHAFETKWGQRYITNNGNSPMGFSMCGAIGAWFADPSRRVVCVIGDGGMNVNIQELATLQRIKANIKIFILNNHCYGITKQYQEVNFQRRTEACTPETGYAPPDFINVARAYGIEAEYLFSQQHINDILDYILGCEGPIVCDVDGGRHSEYTPKITGWNTPIEDMDPKLRRDEFRANMLIEPLPGWEKGEY